MIEPLEARIAPASLTFTDVDGDLVTVTLSKGTFGTSRTGGGDIFGLQLRTITIEADAGGANLTVSAVPQKIDGVLRGDGHAAVGYISATGIDLGAVTIDGDLGAIDAGDGLGVAVKSLSVLSLGAQGTTTGAPDLQSDFFGSLGSLKVTGDIVGAFVRIRGDLGSATIGGNMLGNATTSSGSLYAEGDVGLVKVRGNVVGDLGNFSGSIGAGRNLSAGVTIGGSMIGGDGEDSGTIYNGLSATLKMGSIKIGHDLVGGRRGNLGNGDGAGRIDAAGDIASITIGGSVFGGNGDYSGAITTPGAIGAVTIGGSLHALGSGNNTAYLGAEANGPAARLGVVKIGGSVVGGSGEFGGYLHARRIDSVTIGGDVTGGTGNFSARIEAESPGLGALSIRGSLSGGTDPAPTDDTLLAVRSGTVDVSGNVTKIQLGGSIVGGNVLRAGSIQIDGNLGSLAVSGALQGGAGISSGAVFVDGLTGSVAVGGSIVGGRGNFSGQLTSDLGIAKVTVGGSVIGGDRASSSGSIFAEAGRLGSVSIAGELRGGVGGPAVMVSDSGSIEALRIGAVTISDSFRGADGSFSTVRSGAIIATQDIGAIVVKGSILGETNRPALIYAGILVGAPVGKNLAIKSLTVGGDVRNASIFAGVNSSGAAIASSTQIGAVKVGGDWIASSMGASVVTTVIGRLGDSGTSAVPSPDPSRIASIVIAGQVLGRAGTSDIFGFAAQQIGSFKAGGVAYPLTAGKTNDTWAAGKALAVGPSLAPSTAQKPDGFAVHVYEV